MIQRIAHIVDRTMLILGVIALIIFGVSVPVLLWIIAVALENLR